MHPIITNPFNTLSNFATDYNCINEAGQYLWVAIHHYPNNKLPHTGKLISSTVDI